MPRRRAPRKKSDHGQFMMMFLAGDYPVRVQCIICMADVPSLGGLHDHVVEVHSSYCTRCKSTHSGECKPKPPELTYRFRITGNGVSWETDEEMERRVEAEAHS